MTDVMKILCWSIPISGTGRNRPVPPFCSETGQYPGARSGGVYLISVMPAAGTTVRSNTA